LDRRPEACVHMNAERVALIRRTPEAAIAPQADIAGIT
jgi:hypothetical protein